MNEAIYAARRELFDSLNLPVSRAGVRVLRLRHQIKLRVWETGLASLFVVKRLMDIVVSLAALIMFSPLFLGVALAIVLEDGWPVFFTQDRVGLNGRLFRFYKFRSMYRDAEKRKEALMAQNESSDGVIFKMKNDPRVTRVGRFIRRYSIDEAPQVLNVLVGDLAIVGPRPPVPK